MSYLKFQTSKHCWKQSMYNNYKTELHQAGTAIELRLSRKLVRALEDSGGVLPPEVLPHLQELKNFYQGQLDTELCDIPVNY